MAVRRSLTRRGILIGAAAAAAAPLLRGSALAQTGDAFTQQSWLSDRDLDLIMGQAIGDWMGWPLPA